MVNSLGVHVPRFRREFRYGVLCPPVRVSLRLSSDDRGMFTQKCFRLTTNSYASSSYDELLITSWCAKKAKTFVK
eukprot:6186205-Pleurochrysis_carterae.AAC.1